MIFHMILIHCWLEYSFMLMGWLMDWPTGFFYPQLGDQQKTSLWEVVLVTNVTNLSTGKSWGHRFGGGFWPISEQFSFKQLCLMVKDPSLDPWISYDYKLKKQSQSMFGNSLKRDSNVFLDIFKYVSQLTMVAMVVTRLKRRLRATWICLGPTRWCPWNMCCFLTSH